MIFWVIWIGPVFPFRRQHFCGNVYHDWLLDQCHSYMHFYQTKTDKDIATESWPWHITACLQATMQPEKINPEYELLYLFFAGNSQEKLLKNFSLIFNIWLLQATILPERKAIYLSIVDAAVQVKFWFYKRHKSLLLLTIITFSTKWLSSLDNFLH